MSDGMLIAGGGLAAQRAAETLRRVGYPGPVRIVCAEPHLPYGRPPLSKEVLSGERAAGSVRFRLDSWYEEHDVDLLLGVSATGLRTSEQRLELSDGRALRYEQLLIATGSRSRQLPLLVGYENVSELQTIDDALRLRTEITGVFAAGGAAVTYDHRVERHVQGSHREAAGRQAVRAARAMAGLAPGDVELPSFWADQCGLRIQYLGHAQLADAIRIDGEPEQRNVTATYTRDGAPVAALLVDRTRSLPAMRTLISHGGAR